MPVKILVVDDMTFMVNLAVRRLRDVGYDAIGSTSGWEALEVLRSGEHVDIVVTDQAMPGMNGTDLFRLCKAEFGEGMPPFILYTGSEDITSDIKAVVAAKRMGFVDIVVKSPRMERLLSTLEGLACRLQIA